MLVDIEPMDIELTDIDPETAQHESSLCSSLNRYPLLSLAIVDMPCCLSLHVQLIDKTCSINWSVHLQYFLSTNTHLTNGL